MGRKAKITSADKIEREHRTAAIMQMRLEGHSLRAIGEAQRPPVSGVAIFKTIKRAIERMADEATEQIRRIESLSLDEMTPFPTPARAILWPSIACWTSCGAERGSWGWTRPWAGLQALAMSSPPPRWRSRSWAAQTPNACGGSKPSLKSAASRRAQPA